MKSRTTAFSLFLALSIQLSLAGPVPAQQAADAIAPESATGVAVPGQAVLAKRQMVVAANPIAAQAGLEVLDAGGSAADALVAVQIMLGLVEPQSSGLGGGAFLVWYDAETAEVTTFDARETAPGAATSGLFLDAGGKPLDFFTAVIGGRSVGVPGVVRLMETVHGRYGKLEWPSLFTAAAELAENGFVISPRLAALIEGSAEVLGVQPSTRAYFMDADSKPLQAGSLLRNPAYAATLQTIAAAGADAFYSGPIAEGIVAAVKDHPTNPGQISSADLSGYVVKERKPVCAPYREFEVCGMGPPSSGALAVGQILGMVSGFDLAALGAEDPESWRILGDATRLAFADRERYVADSDFVTIPKGLLNPDYLAARAQLLRRPTALGKDDVAAGDPPWDRAELRVDGATLELPSTTHVVIVDSAGNVASMTSSIETAFGAHLMSGGFLLNNQLTDFSFRPDRDGSAVANRVEPGKRPRSSMSPTIVLRDGRPAYALGSPGGSNIIPYVAKTLVALIDWDLDMQAAIALPHLTNRFSTYDLEAGTTAETMAKDLEALGFKVAIREQNSGLHGVAFTPDGLAGGADPRREGVALGD